MDIRQLEYFRAVVEAGNISEAARRLHLSQPPVSFQMKQLEQELNVTLFERGRKEIKLTEAGKILYARAGELLSYADSTAREVAGAGTHHQFRLGMTPTVITTMMPYLKKYSRSHPDTRFEIHDGNTYQLSELLSNDTIDAAAIRTPVKTADLNTIILKEDDMIAVSQNQLNSTRTVTLEQLVQHPVILYRRYQTLILDAFHTRGLNPDIFCLCDDGRDALLWCEAGLATAIVPGSMRSLAQGMAIQKIKAEDLNTRILLAWKKDRSESDLLNEFVLTFNQR